MRDVIVVGCGIIGATVAAALRNQGREVLVLDDGREMSGTAPSGGHLKPSWFGGMAKAEYEPAMELLDTTWGLHEEEFTVWPTRLKTTVFRVDTDLVLQAPRTVSTVLEIEPYAKRPSVVYGDVREQCHTLVVCAGAWCDELVPGLRIVPKRGVSFRFSGQVSPFIKPWAPYKQVVAHQQSSDEIWIGDGSAILADNWNIKRTNQCLKRCRNALPDDATLLRSLTGIRPYCETEGKDPCLLKKLGTATWIATGAGKSGTIAAGWVARRLLDATS